MRFLVIHADAERRDGLKTLLRQIARQASCHDAAHHKQAEQLVGRHRFDLVVADWHDIQRLGDLEALCQICAPVPVAMLTDQISPEFIKRFFAIGVRGVIPRATPTPLILRAFELVLLGGLYVPPAAIGLTSAPPSESARIEPIAKLLEKRPRLPYAQLSERQKQVMRCVHMGCTNKMIARALGISEGTVKIHLSSIFQQLGATNRAGAIALYNGWLQPQLEVLTRAQDSAPKPVHGAHGPIPLRARLAKRRYSPHAENSAYLNAQAAETLPRFVSRRSGK